MTSNYEYSEVQNEEHQALIQQTSGITTVDYANSRDMSTMAQSPVTLASLAAQYKKFNCCMWCCFMTALLMSIFTAAICEVMNGALMLGANSATVLSEKNSQTVLGIPGKYDINVTWAHYLYNCTNLDDVIFRNQRPEFKEFGPFLYQEYDTFTDNVWESLEMPIGSGKNYSAVWTTFNEELKFVGDSTNMMDTPLWLPNQAGMGVWYQQQTTPLWRLFMTVLYTDFYYGLGSSVVEQAIWQQLRAIQFNQESQINKLLFTNPENPLDSTVAALMWSDPYYGLENYLNYVRYQGLVNSTADPNIAQACKSEIASYFNLNTAQLTDLITNWNEYYFLQQKFVYQLGPVDQEYLGVQSNAYWQWAASYFTRDIDMTEYSITDQSAAAAGYPEFSAWKKNYFLPIVQDSTDQTNYETFKDIKMYNSLQDGNNYEYLFNLTNSEDKPVPDTSSLFNVQTIKQFVDICQWYPNVAHNPDQIYGTDFVVNSTFTDFAMQTLKLSETTGAEQLYLLCLWSQTAMEQSFAREPDGGDKQIGIIGTLGATALWQSMTYMQLEFPPLIYAQQFYQTILGVNTCSDIFSMYVNDVFTQEMSDSLCTSSQYFTFIDQFQSCYALVNMDMYANAFQEQYYNDFQNTTGLTDAQMEDFQIQFGTQDLYAQVQLAVYTHYKAIGLCDSEVITSCAFSNLTYNQWFTGAVLKNPMDGFSPNSTSYVRAFPSYTQLTLPFELDYYNTESGDTAPPSATIGNVYESLNETGLYAAAIFQDVFLSFTPEGYQNIWQSEGFMHYLRYVSVNMGLSGMFLPLTPSQILNGYNDKLIETLSVMPVYMGGDQTTSPFLSMIAPPIHPKDNRMAYITGEDGNHDVTRYVARWLEKDYLTIAGKDYASISEVVEANFSPWKENMTLDGTDVIQFPPNEDKDFKPQGFVWDLSRNGHFNFDHADTDSFKPLEVQFYILDEKLMQNMTENPDNTNFETYVTGTGNLTTTLKIPAFISKGHYYQVTDEVASSKPLVISSLTNEEIVASASEDETLIGVESKTGVTCSAYESLLTSLQVFNSWLFVIEGNDNAYGQFVPLLLVVRATTLDDSQMHQVFGALYLGITLKWCFFAVLLVLSILCFSLGGVYLCKRKKIKQQMLLHNENPAAQFDNVKEFTGITVEEETADQRRRQVEF